MKQNQLEAIYRQYQPIDCIILDFDGTFIREHILIIWVLFLLIKSKLSIKRKFLFFFNSFSRGAISSLFSSGRLTSEWAVRLAYKTFQGIDVNTIDEMINYKKGKKGYAVNLNTEVTDILEIMLCNTSVMPEIWIYSQGSFNYVIRKFMQRRDVKDCLNKIGICADSIIINANELETDDNGKFTGTLSGKIQTKFNRINDLNKNTVFIGDSKDEAALKKMELQTVKFINWTNVGATGRSPLHGISNI